MDSDKTTVVCAKCQGTGQIEGSPCAACRGIGRVSQHDAEASDQKVTREKHHR